ncbi:MAG: DUF1367 family protein [Comamonadaceae bacterium]|nr:MAG: DUF1367 family protein [Comamonadaceae bacterium]
MSSVVLYRAEDGKLAGLGDKGHRQYEKFKRAAAALEPGETLQFEYRLPRSAKHHRYFFWKLKGLFDRQEMFEHEEDMRAWVLVGAGYCHFVPGTDGQLVAIPQSMDWAKLEEADFLEVHRRVDAFLWELRARRVLWPHIDEAKSFKAVEAWRAAYDNPCERKSRTVQPAAIDVEARVIG